MFQIMVIAGMRDTTYLPTTPKDQIVPGGYNKGICHGIPYNKYANFINKMTGNAGLFSTIDNMANYMQVMLNKGHLNLTKVFPFLFFRSLTGTCATRNQRIGERKHRALY